jgi:hypothetical protein
MAYRDESAARARLASLERELAERRHSRTTLQRYRNALILEVTRLRHAVVWYENGEKFGFNKLPRKDDLSPAEIVRPPVPGVEQFDRSLRALDEEALATRARDVMRELAVADPKLAWLQGDIESLREECTALRARVADYTARHPDHPPPPEYNPVAVLAVGGMILLALTALGMLMVVGAY